MPDVSSEAVFILVFLLISFLSWLTEKVKGGRSGPSPEERPTPRVESSPPPPRRAPRPPRTEAQPQRPGDAMREILQSLGIPVEEEPESPPPLPDDPVFVEEPPPLEVAPVEEKAGPVLSKAEQRALEKIRKGETATKTSRPKGADASIRSLLHPQSIRTAFILKEILDRPRSLQDRV